MRLLKKVFSIFLALNLLLLNVGVSVYQHYCGGELVSSYAIDTEGAMCCDGETEEEPADCCQNKTLNFKIEDKFSAVSFLYKFISQISYILPAFNVLSIENNNNKYTTYLSFYTDPPPLLHQVVGISILYSVFTI